MRYQARGCFNAMVINDIIYHIKQWHFKGGVLGKLLHGRFLNKLDFFFREYCIDTYIDCYNLCSLFSPPASNPWARTDLVQEKLISVLFSRQDTLSRKLCVLFWRICCYRNEIPLTFLLLSAQVEHQTSRKSLRLLSVSRCSVSGKLPARCQAGWSIHSFRSHPYGHSAGSGFGVCTTGHARNALGRFSKRRLGDPSKWGKPSVISGSAIDHHTETRDGFLVLHLPRWGYTCLLRFLGSLITFLAFPIVSQKLLTEFSFPQVNRHISYLKNPEGSCPHM